MARRAHSHLYPGLEQDEPPIGQLLSGQDKPVTFTCYSQKQAGFPERMLQSLNEKG